MIRSQRLQAFQHVVLLYFQASITRKSPFGAYKELVTHDPFSLFLQFNRPISQLTMQLLTTVALFAASTAGAALVSRQAPPGPANGPGTAAGIAGLFNNVGGSVKPIKVEDVKPLIRPTAKRIQIRYGPFVLPASKVRAFLNIYQWLV